MQYSEAGDSSAHVRCGTHWHQACCLVTSTLDAGTVVLLSPTTKNKEGRFIVTLSNTHTDKTTHISLLFMQNKTVRKSKTATCTNEPHTPLIFLRCTMKNFRRRFFRLATVCSCFHWVESWTTVLPSSLCWSENSYFWTEHMTPVLATLARPFFFFFFTHKQCT